MPKIAKIILNLILPDDMREYLSGDIEDIYNSKREKQGLLFAHLWCYYTVLVNIPGFLKSSIQWGSTMFLKNLKLSFRHLWRQKTFSAINITGLSLSLLAAVFIWLWINDEMSYDKFHKNSESIYTVEVNLKYGNENHIWKATPQMLGEQLKNDFEDITGFVTLHRGYRVFLKAGEDVFHTRKCFYTTPEISEIFDINLIKGEISEALKNKESIVLSEKAAKKHFGDTNPVGKRVILNNNQNLLVTGVFKDIPANSHLEIDYLIPLSLLKPSADWGKYDYYNYVKISDQNRVADFSVRLENYLDKFKQSDAKLYLRPVKDIHLYTVYGKGNISNIYFFAAIGLVILIVGCINYVNLSTARSTQREKEVGIRKVVGADKNDLVKQLFAESFLTTLISFVFTLILVVFTLEVFNSLSGKNLLLSDLANRKTLIGLFVIFMVTSICSGFYPAFYISRFNPFRNLNAERLNGTGNSKTRRVLILVQFTAAVVLITFTLFVNEQISFIKNKKLGFDKEQILCVQTHKLGRQLTAFKDKVKNLSKVEKLSVASQLPVNMGNFTTVTNWEGLTEKRSVIFLVMGVDQNYFDLMGMELSEGSNFKFAHNGNNIILNETAVKKIGLENPVGKSLSYWKNKAKIEGIVKDFHNKPLHQGIQPVILYHDKGERGTFLYVKLKAGQISETVSEIENIYNKMAPGTPFIFTFIDENVDRMYKAEMNFQQIVKYFSSITIITALMGLIGLTIFSVERKTKEIGIRKVLGASALNIFKMISKEFVALIITANLIAVPVSYYLVALWLENYSYKISITAVPFILVTAAVILAGYLTILFNAYKKLSLNPVDSIKND